jgi:RNA polymerase sigma-70 factor (ECF subfamily)
MKSPRPDEPAQLSEQDLATAMAAGQTEALAALYDRYAGIAYAVAVRVLGDAGRAEDVVQEAFLKVWHSSANFDARRGSLRTWILAVTRNRAIDHLRGRAGRERQEIALPATAVAGGHGSDPWLEVEIGLERQAVKDALASLPADQRQVIELCYFGGYTQREVAQLTRVPLSTVKGRTRLALEKLHSYLIGRGVPNA